MTRACIAALVLTTVFATAQAHHSRAAFQLDRTTVLTVRVTEVRWTNPHVFLVGEVINEQGEKEQWTFEGHSISGLVRLGWSKDTIGTGDEVQMVVNRHRDPSKHFGLIDYAILADGTKMYSVGQSLQAVARRAAPEPSKDFSGNWRFQFPGTPEQVRQRVLLGPAKPTLDGPYTERARTQLAAYDENSNPVLSCGPISLPALLMTVYEYKWIRLDDRILIQKEQLLDADRVIYLKNTARSADYKPSPLGHSVGRFEPDGTLVVETTGFSAVPWGNGSGLDSSERKRIVERYKLAADGLSMSLSYTHEDPLYYTAAVTGQGAFAKSANVDFARQPPCDIKAARQHLEFEQ